MIKQFVRRKLDIVRAVRNTYIKKINENYSPEKFYDAHYNKGISDRQTIHQNTNLLSSMYHYSSVEMQILKYLCNNNIATDDLKVIDIGSGAGHWIDFYKGLGCSVILGLDVSNNSVDYLKAKYSENENITIHHGKACDLLYKLKGRFHIVNAIGVMFHIVDDSEWFQTIELAQKVLIDNGLFIVGGHFGILNYSNVRITKDNEVYKSLRSKRCWMKSLKKAGFSETRIYRNNAYLWIKDWIPQNNVLVAKKGGIVK